MSDFASTFAAQLRGMFKLESTSVVIMERVADVEAAGARLRSSRKPQGLDSLEPCFDEGVSTAIDSLFPVLTYLHEQDHFKVLCSTPVGLLLWRIEQCLSVDVSYLRSRLPDVTSDRYPTFLDAWAEAAQTRPNTGPHSAILKETASGASALRIFLGMVIGRSDATIGQFLETANAAFAYLALRSGLPLGNHAHWESEIDPTAPLLEPSMFSLIEILEASARARELTNLEGIRLAQSVVDQWYERTIFGLYRPAFTYLMAELGSSSWAKTAVDLSLGTAMDISAGRPGETLRVEDVLPSYRLLKIVAALRERTWNLNMGDPGNYHELYVELPHSLGMLSLPEIYQRMAKADFSLQANWGGKLEIRSAHPAVKDATVKHFVTFCNSYLAGEQYLKFVEEQYRRNFKLRVENPTHFITAQSGTVHQPLLTFFRDQLKVTEELLGESPSLAFAAFQQFCTRERSRAYLYDDEVSDLTHFENLFQNWCLGIGVPKSFVEGVLRAQSLIEFEGSEGFAAENLFNAFKEFVSEISEDEIGT